MIARLLTRWASRLLSSKRQDPREAYRAKARQMYVDQGKPVPKVLR